jgi:hypothetical protein
MTVRRIKLSPENYEARQTVGGGEVQDVLPWEGAVSYVTDGEQYGVEYGDGAIDWLGAIADVTVVE